MEDRVVRRSPLKLPPPPPARASLKGCTAAVAPPWSYLYPQTAATQQSKYDEKLTLQHQYMQFNSFAPSSTAFCQAGGTTAHSLLDMPQGDIIQWLGNAFAGPWPIHSSDPSLGSLNIPCRPTKHVGAVLLVSLEGRC